MLKIIMSCERGVKAGIKTSSWIRRAAWAALAEEGLRQNAEISVLLTDDEGIRAMNREFRQKDAATDVLSFPANALERPLAKELAEGFQPETDPRTGRLILGDIAISTERAAAQAKEYGHALKREISFLTIHAMLHLTGYDHMNADEEKIMTGKQEMILNRLKIGR